MRTAVVIIILTGCLVGLWRGRSTVWVPLNSTGYELGYTVRWGTGMALRLTLARPGAAFSSHRTGWIKIYDKPYNSGASLYVSDDGAVFYVSTGLSFITIVPSSRSMIVTCSPEAEPDLAPFGEVLRNADRMVWNDLDPDAPRLFSHVYESELSEELPAVPSPSRYYLGVKYLGRFGVTEDRQNRRGGGVGFVSAESAPEPRFGLSFSCG